MEINYYRHPNVQGEGDSWQSCQFTHETELSPFSRITSLVTLNGQPILRQHHSTYLTGKDTCRAHHFAKFLAIQVLSGTTENQKTATPSSTPTSRQGCQGITGCQPVTPGCKVLWIDTLHNPYISTRIYHELVAHAPAKESLHFVCLDILGSQRENFYLINRKIEALIRQYKPELVVIDDIDHFMPFCGVHIATQFCNIVRDVTNHTETAFLFVGYNHLGKKASTTGNLGKYLFIDASDVFSLSTQREITTVRLAKSYDMSRNPDRTQFQFTIGEDNLPHEFERAPSNIPQDIPTSSSSNEPPPEDINSSTAKKSPESSDSCSSTATKAPESSDSSSSNAKKSPEGSDSCTSHAQCGVNNSLTLPTHPQVPPCHDSLTSPAGSPCRSSVPGLRHGPSQSTVPRLPHVPSRSTVPGLRHGPSQQ